VLTSNSAPAMSTWSTTWSCGRAQRSSQPLKSTAATDALADGCGAGTNMLPELCPGSPCRRRRHASAARFSSPDRFLRPRWSLATLASAVLIRTCSAADETLFATHHNVPANQRTRRRGQQTSAHIACRRASGSADYTDMNMDADPMKTLE